MTLFFISVSLGSFLLFQVQPLIGRYILPWFGGGPAVWTTCMLFFQVMLLAGYGYAHLLTLSARRTQAAVHGALLATAILFLPIAPSPRIWKPSPETDPVTGILLLLAANVGVPFLALAATAPLLQHWFAKSYPGRSPYRLYALSNAASLLALLSYPILFEPSLTLKRQAVAWSWGFALFAAVCLFSALRPESVKAPPTAKGTYRKEEAGDAGISPAQVLLWLLLSGCGSALLLAATNQLCQEVAVVPFLWVAPLALYLLSYALCFNGGRATAREIWGFASVCALPPAYWLLHAGADASLPLQLAGYLGTLFVFCMACHGELYRARPEASRLTLYYLAIAAGGALGGSAVALFAPLFFQGFWEFPVAISASTAAVGLGWLRDRPPASAKRWPASALVLLLLLQGAFTAWQVRKAEAGAMASSRNFYGVLKVVRLTDRLGEKLYLRHGRIMHGSQYADQSLRRLATTYYGPESGAGLALRFHPRRDLPAQVRGGLRVGVIGLGVGTLAAYGESGDTFRFYEINGKVSEFADRYFTYRRDSKAGIETVGGDARITLENEYLRGQPQRFDLLAVDAFSSDSIPAHLLTAECFALYRYHLAPDGLLLVHVTNRFLDLIPVVQAQAARLGLHAALIRSEADNESGVSRADWLILSSNRAFFEKPEVAARLSRTKTPVAEAPLWTDDFVSPWQVLKW